MLNRISFSGFKSFKASKLELHTLNVLIGANGAGKSNFIQLWGLLEALFFHMLQKHIQVAGGAERLLHYGSKETSSIDIKLEFEQMTYGCSLIPTLDNRLIFDQEFFALSKAPDTPAEKSQSALLGSGHSETQFLAPPRGKGVEAMLLQTYVAGMHVYHFHDTSPSAKIRKPVYIGDSLSLAPDGANLPAVLYGMQTRHPKQFQLIQRMVQRIAPFIDTFILRERAGEQSEILFEWQERHSRRIFDINYLSDGTIRFLCLATLLLQPEPQGLILIDEPELGLHPSAIHLLAAMLQQAAKQSQLIVATQSPTLINQLEPEDIIITEQQQGQSQLRRLDSSELNLWLQDYSLGELWEKNVFGGKPAL